MFSGADKVRRWYLIDSVTVNADKTKDVRIIRHWWGAKDAGRRCCTGRKNYSYDGHERPIEIHHRAGANVYDVSEAIDNPNRREDRAQLVRGDGGRLCAGR